MYRGKTFIFFAGNYTRVCDENGGWGPVTSYCKIKDTALTNLQLQVVQCFILFVHPSKKALLIRHIFHLSPINVEYIIKY
jgi:hypothetical protein